MKFLILLILPLSLFGQKEIFTVFYNVENLFDTINNPEKNDDEFLPYSEKKWDSNKYNKKLENIAMVLENINPKGLPNLIGLCEVENKKVVEDLIYNSELKQKKYDIVHKDSPDKRGIDCALIFDENFELIMTDFIEVVIPESKKPTRDILYAKLKYENDFLHVFVNHWPSRWGGQEKTEHRRIAAAKTLRNYIDKNIKKSKNIIVMGDLNDTPYDVSIEKVLLNDNYINHMTSKSLKDKGSYNYRGDWSFIDQIITSKNFLNKKIISYECGVFMEDWIMYKNKEGDHYPSRTYGGNNWYGGYSDHLPIYYKMILN
tara:strand:+ start:4026 stop:4973 length:948 start_codon:yes stop_codon:yes gene_type:complete